MLLRLKCFLHLFESKIYKNCCDVQQKMFDLHSFSLEKYLGEKKNLKKNHDVCG